MLHPFSIVAGVTELLMSPSKYPGCSGTRNLHDNLSDLRAQVAANQKVSYHMRREKIIDIMLLFLCLLVGAHNVCFP